MDLDIARFRRTMGLLATGVAVVATEVGQQVHAMTANAVSSLSLDPMLVLFCPAKRARFAALLPTLQGLSINFLREDQEALSSYFAGAIDASVPAPPFRFVHAGDIPRLEGSLASLLCRPHSLHDGGDHWLVTARVHEVHQGIEPHRPLLFFKGEYRNINSQHITPAPDIAYPADEPALLYYHD